MWELYQYFFNLHWEDIYSLNDKHIIAASLDTVDAEVCTSARTFSGKNTGKVTGTITYKRHHFAIKSGQYQLTDFSIRNGFSCFRINYFDEVAIFPEMHAVLFLTFKSNAGAIHFCHTEAIIGFNT